MHYIKLLTTLFLLLALVSCDRNSVEEFSFKKTIISTLSDKCSTKNCANAVKTQSDICADKANWRQFFDNQDDPNEKPRFQKAYFACIVDPKGNPYFHLP